MSGGTPSAYLPSQTPLARPPDTTRHNRVVHAGETKPKRKKKNLPKGHVPKLERLVHRLKKTVDELHDMKPKFSKWVRDSDTDKEMEESGQDSKFTKHETGLERDVGEMRALCNKLEVDVRGITEAIAHAREEMAKRDKKPKAERKNKTGMPKSHQTVQDAVNQQAEANLRREAQNARAQAGHLPA